MNSWGLKLIVAWQKGAVPAALSLTAFATDEQHAKKKAVEIITKINKTAIVKKFLIVKEIKEKEE